MSLDPRGIVAQAFHEAIVSTITHLAGTPPTVEKAPDLITDGVVGQIHIVGGWSGTITAHCSESAVHFLEEQMPTLLIDRNSDKSLAVVEILLDTVANAFMRKFVSKSEVSAPTALPRALAQQPRQAEVRELWKVSCALPKGVFSFSLSESTGQIEGDGG